MKTLSGATTKRKIERKSPPHPVIGLRQQVVAVYQNDLERIAGREKRELLSGCEAVRSW